MARSDKIRNKVERLKGKAKEAAGKVTGDEQLKVAGKAKQAKGKLKEAGEKAKDAVKDALGKEK